MGLAESCKNYVDEIVVVKPVYGFGWSRRDAPEIDVPAEVDGVPRPFRCRLKSLFYYQNELRGATARIEEPDHIYHDLWTAFYTRVVGTFDFTNRLPRCNIEIGSVEPVLINGWHEFTAGRPIVNGYCLVGESLSAIERHQANLR